MLVIPAIDLRGGKCVRLFRGRPDQETVYDTDPVAVARTWEAQGAPWLHVVDLDGAFSGRPRHGDVVAAIVQAVAVPVQLGGGIRTWEAIEAALGLGVRRVILGTAAVTDPALVARACATYGEAVVVGIDAKEGRVAIAGWETTVAKEARALAQDLSRLGVRRIVYTDTARDGTLEGLNLEGIKAMATAAAMKMIVAGGVASLADLRALKELEPLGVEGVILGRALYTGDVRLEEALAVAEG